MIALSELLKKMRDALSSISMPDLPSGEALAVPDLTKFDLPPILPNNNCNGNDKTISLDIIYESSVLEITICTFLEFETIGELSAVGLFDDFEGSITLDLDTEYVLKGMPHFAHQITHVTNLCHLTHFFLVLHA